LGGARHGIETPTCAALGGNKKQNRFQIEKLEERIAPRVVVVNGGGNTPNGEANGVPRENPAGDAPPGHNN
jgi:hypothetical protein